MTREAPDTGCKLVVGDPVVTLAAGSVAPGGVAPGGVAPGGVPPGGLVPDGAVLVRGSWIAEIGRRDELARRYPQAEVVGSRQDVVLPGLVNAHFHSDFHLDPRWLRHPIERGNVHVRALDLDGEQLYRRTLERGLACLRAGQTTVLDFVYGVPGLDHLGLPSILRAYDDLGIRAAVAVAVRDRHHYVHGSDDAFLDRLPPDVAAHVRPSGLGYPRPPDESLRAFEAMHADGHGSRERTRLLLAPDWTPSVSDDLYTRAAKVADEAGTWLTGHAAETRLEVRHSIATEGKTPIRRLADLGVLSERSAWAHTTWTTDDDHRILRDSGATAILNPGSNLRMGAGIPRAAAMCAAGVRVALGTDGMALHPEDLLGEACLAAYLDRDFGDVAEEPLDPLWLLAAAQVAGARATGFGAGVAALRPGTEADLVVLRPGPAVQDSRLSATTEGYAVVEHLRGATVTAALVAGQRVLDQGWPVRLGARGPARTHRRLVEQPPRTDDWAAAPTVSRALDRGVVEYYAGWDPVPVEPSPVPTIRTVKGP